MKKQFFKGILVSAVFVTLWLMMCSCGAGSFNGTYDSITSNRSYVFEHDKDNTGNFEMYDDGEKVGDSNKRYENTWELKDDVLIMKRNDSVYGYYKVFGDVLVEIKNEESDPEMFEYIAPKGKKFDWEYGAYEFYKNGTVYEYSKYSGMSRSGDYYVDNNIIYAKLDYSNANIYGYEAEYEPLFYIYNNEYIAVASDVLIKK